MKSLISHLLRSLVDFILRRRSPALVLVRSGLALIVVAIGISFFIDIQVPFQDGTFHLALNTDGGTPVLVTYLVVGLGVLMVTIGVAWEFWRALEERQLLSRKKVVVLETRGLRHSVGKALLDSLPNELKGRRESILIDFRQGIQDGKIFDPQAAADRLDSLPSEFLSRSAGNDRNNLTIAYGGLSPVPLTFLTGVLVDDEDSVVVYDWDRHAGKWRALDEDDDGKRFVVSGLDAVPAGAKDAILAVSVSYAVDETGVRSKRPAAPIVFMKLQDGNPNCHWSKDKQQALGQQFLDTVVELNNRGVKKIHLFLAAQNSIVFRFGRLYDKRNLPKIILYQYQPEETPPYPWGLMMPTSGIRKPVVVSD